MWYENSGSLGYMQPCRNQNSNRFFYNRKYSTKQPIRGALCMSWDRAGFKQCQNIDCFTMKSLSLGVQENLQGQRLLLHLEIQDILKKKHFNLLHGERNCFDQWYMHMTSSSSSLTKTSKWPCITIRRQWSTTFGRFKARVWSNSN